MRRGSGSAAGLILSSLRREPARTPQTSFFASGRAPPLPWWAVIRQACATVAAPVHTSLLAPSILAGQHIRLAESAAQVVEAGATWLHLDIMDGHFVPNLTFGPQMVAELRREVPGLFFDVHLMLSEPQHYIEAFAKAGAQLISFHLEPELDHRALLARVRELGCQTGLVLNPGTPVEVAEPFLDEVDLMLVMTVQPGFGGQSFRRDMLPKLSRLDGWRRERELQFRLEVDGGVDLQTGVECRSAGADTFVAGTAFFKAPDRAAFVRTVSGW